MMKTKIHTRTYGRQMLLLSCAALLTFSGNSFAFGNLMANPDSVDQASASEHQPYNPAATSASSNLMANPDAFDQSSASEHQPYDPAAPQVSSNLMLNPAHIK